jgi:hypothetical protein
MSTEQDKLLYAKINLETARISWKELERFFAGGRIISVVDHLDMIRVAQLMASDDVTAISAMLEKKEIGKVTDEQARIWSDSEASLWAVVVNPWILVQQRRS